MLIQTESTQALRVSFLWVAGSRTTFESHHLPTPILRPAQCLTISEKKPQTSGVELKDFLQVEPENMTACDNMVAVWPLQNP